MLAECQTLGGCETGSAKITGSYKLPSNYIIHAVCPRYLDGKGLVALWREGLLAKAVLEGKTRGYVHHPQLARFRAQPDPVGAINAYLHFVLLEGCARNYCFDENKLLPVERCPLISVTDGQICY